MLQVSSLNFNNNYKKCNSQNVSFEGLTRYLEKDIYAFRHKDVEKLVETYNKPMLIVGHFPKDLLEVFKSQSSSASDLKHKIKVFNSILALQARKLNSFEANSIRKAKSLDIGDLFYSALLKYFNEPDKVYLGFVDCGIKFKQQPDEMEQILNNVKNDGQNTSVSVKNSM